MNLFINRYLSKINNLNECRYVSYKNRLRRDSLTLNEMYELSFNHLFKSLFSSFVQGQLDKVKVLPLFVEFIHIKKNLIKINCRYKSFMAS